MASNHVALQTGVQTWYCDTAMFGEIMMYATSLWSQDWIHQLAVEDACTRRFLRVPLPVPTSQHRLVCCDEMASDGERETRGGQRTF